MMAAAISMTMFATSVDLFAAALKPLTEGIALMFETIGPAVVKGLIGSFQELLNGVRTLLPQILTLVGDILKSVIEIIMDQSADIAEAAMTLIDNLLQTLANHSESIFNSIFTVIQSLLDQLKDHGPEIGDDIANIVIGIFDDIGRNSQKILDHMGSEELAANLFRLTQTEGKLRRDNIQGKENANIAHREVGAKVRQTIKELGGTMPEDLPTPPKSIKQLEKEQKKLEKK